MNEYGIDERELVPREEPEEYTRDDLSRVLGEPFVRGLEMMSGNPNRRLISLEIGDEITGKTELEDEE